MIAEKADCFSADRSRVKLECYHSGGKKYIVYMDKGENGNPKGQRTRFLDTNKSRDISEWLKDKNATPFD